MVDIREAMREILRRPTPAALVELQGALMASGMQGDGLEQALEIAGQFFSYLCELNTKGTARDLSELASRLDIGAVGAVALENIVTSKGEELWRGALLGLLGEGLMVAASRQYVKAWEVEAGQVHTCAAWHLTEALWRASMEMQPDTPPEDRWQSIQTLLAPVYLADTPATEKALLLGRVYQLLLLSHVTRLLQTP
ncbi:hypothetical protein ACFLT5_03875 [Chloroflexota bacterium]